MQDNCQRLINALLDTKFETAFLTSAEDILSNEITVFQDRVRIDVQTKTPGLRFKDAWNNCETMDYHGHKFYVVSRNDLINSKLAAGRDIDLEDVRILKLGRNE